MNCNEVAERIPALANGLLPADEHDACRSHVDTCDDCADALRGANALQFLRKRDTGAAPEGLFDRVLDDVTLAAENIIARRRFWLGTAVGGAVAASLLVVVMMLGVLVRPGEIEPARAEFYVSTEEARTMHIAIEADQALPGAEISILLSGAVEVDGTAGRRELTWTDDLESGINRLSLPLLASGVGGGQMVVMLRHPDSEQMFVIDLPLDT
jgi:hypothetical protein